MESSKKKSGLNGRRPAILREDVSRRLGNYALAATAAGVAALACAIPAEGAPVCKSLTADLFHTGTYPINPAGQLAAPFNVAQTTYSYFHSTTGISHLSWWNRGFFTPNSAGAKVLLGTGNLPANLASGAPIGPGGNFGKGTSYGLLFTYGRGTLANQGHGTLKSHRGNFNLQQTNLIGFQFSKAGAIHYGWARLSVSLIPERSYGARLYQAETHLLGFGYETTANAGIAAGSCTDDAATAAQPDRVTASQANSAPSEQTLLGLLALGSLRLSSK
jgi:hypothetical protein